MYTSHVSSLFFKVQLMENSEWTETCKKDDDVGTEVGMP
jgi:hypothetical protein